MLRDTDPMPFGKHKGLQMANVPDSYLLWLYEKDKQNQSLSMDMRRYITRNLDAIKLNIKNGKT